MNIHLGYEVADPARGVSGGKAVNIPRKNLAVTGQTQESGKTTTLEALITRSGLRAIAFITKRGEKSFRMMTPIAPYFQEQSGSDPYWKFVCAVIEAQLDISLGFEERGWIMKLCKDYTDTVLSKSKTDKKGKRLRETYSWKTAESLQDLQRNVEAAMPHLRGRQEMVCIQLSEFLRIIIPEIQAAGFANHITLSDGINVMDISRLSTPLQMLVIRSVIEWVYQKASNTIVIIPEAWQFIPEGRTTPVQLAAEELIRKGSSLHNHVWIDSQDLRGVSKLIMRSVPVCIFGVQRERNEIKNMLDSLPDLGRKPDATEIMRLQKGQFFVAYGDVCVKTYVQPAGMGDVHAQAIARGEEEAESWVRIAKDLDAQAEEQREKREAKLRAARQSASAIASANQFLSLTGNPALIPAAAVEVEDETEDPMWKERAELAEKRSFELEAETATLRREVEDLRRQLKASATRPKNKQGDPVGPSNGFCGEECSAPSLDAIWPELRRRIAADPQLLALATAKPEIVVSVKRNTISMSEENLMGQIAKLLAQGFFKDAKNGPMLQKELKRRGNDQPTTNLYKPLNRLTEMGFLTLEADGYQEVTGMKSRIVEE